MLLELALSAAAALLVSLAVCRVTIAAGPLDMPNAGHKAHAAPTPTGGGVGIAIGFAIGLATLSLVSGDGAAARLHQIPGVTLGCGVAYAFALVGLVDDARPLGAGLKLLIFAALSLTGAIAIGLVHELPMPGGAILHVGYAFGLVGTGLWVFTLVNCVNFMDGANGLAMGSTAIALAALAAISHALGAPGGVAIGVCAAGALLGFLVWNFPKGRLFAGDSGSLFVGAVAALASLFIIARADLSPLVPPILFFPLLADVLLTLAWRVSQRRSLLEGHCEHLYQIASRAGLGSAFVAPFYWLAMVVCGVLGFFTATTAINPWGVLAFLALMSILIFALVRGAARKKAQ